MKNQDDNSSKNVVQLLIHQFEGMWGMLNQAIKNIPTDLWAKEDNEWFFSLTAYHVVETADFYERSSPEEMEFGKRLGQLEWWKHISHQEAANRLSKSLVQKYLEEVQTKVKTTLEKSSMKDLLAKDKFQWFNSRLEKFVYLLRHNAHHIGELAKKLRNEGSNRIKWT
ncbi:MAG: DinB family protein [Candidatus Ranarchaeia archaeon]